MFIKIKKNCGIYMEHNGMEKNHILPVTSNFLINLGHAAEISFYTIKEAKTRYDLEGHKISVPPHTRIIHLQMAYRYSSTKEKIGDTKGSIVERNFYKFYFKPEEMGQYEELRTHIEKHVLNL
ncbi:hypothetical protein EH243_16630 [Amphritea opalescens]|uniref:Uncharacterized protein n=1 Tax=Amphritea opalescens TaxID=2490544 RepID=A0A430KM81_9GAMM|nr:hypothetical protein [Amphritea opalescens]RTE64587.1 hypothetical protein EH243_16630 [Amphritea opalescens]